MGPVVYDPALVWFDIKKRGKNIPGRKRGKDKLINVFLYPDKLRSPSVQYLLAKVSMINVWMALEAVVSFFAEFTAITIYPVFVYHMERWTDMVEIMHSKNQGNFKKFRDFKDVKGMTDGAVHVDDVDVKLF
jgi:predicted ABC-type exoprotein transport system permease subunit